MGKVEDCVSRKLKDQLSPGEEPSKQDLAIKFSECRKEVREASINSLNVKLATISLEHKLNFKKKR